MGGLICSPPIYRGTCPQQAHAPNGSTAPAVRSKAQNNRTPSKEGNKNCGITSVPNSSPSPGPEASILQAYRCTCIKGRAFTPFHAPPLQWDTPIYPFKHFGCLGLTPLCVCSNKRTDQPVNIVDCQNWQYLYVYIVILSLCHTLSTLSTLYRSIFGGGIGI